MLVEKIFSEINGEEKLYSVKMNEDEMSLFSEFQKEFNSKSQKARRRKLEAGKGKDYITSRESDFMKSYLDGRAKHVKTNNEIKEATSKLDGKKPKLGNVDQIAKKDPTTEASISKFRDVNKSDGTIDRLAEKARLSKNGLKNKMESDLQRYKMGKIHGELDYNLGEKQPKLGNSPYDLGKKKAYKEQVLAAEKRATIIAKKKASKDSIAHHQEIANALKKKKVINIAKKSALGTAAVVGSGIVAKKIYDKNRKDKK